MPVVISQDLIISASSGAVQSLDHARIGYQSHLEDATLSASISGDSGFPLNNVLSGQTFERYKSTSSGTTTITADLGSTKSANYLGIVGKNVVGIFLQYSLDNVTYIPVENFSDATKKAKLLLFSAISARYWRIIVIGEGSDFDIANIKIGTSLDMTQLIYSGHSPVTLSRITAFNPNISEGGEFIGRSRQRQGFSTTYNYNNLDPAWYRSNFDPFVEYARTGTYYISWRPSDYPLEVVYGWTNEDIVPVNVGNPDLMQVSFNTRGYDAE